MLRRVGVAVALAGLLALPAAKTFAAPYNAPSAQFITLQCSNNATFTVLVNSGQSGNHGQGNSTTFGPGFIVSGGTGKLIPLSIGFSGTDVTKNMVLFSDSQTKGQAQGPQGAIVQCSATLGTSIATAQDVAMAPDIISVGDTLQFSINVTAVVKAH